MARQSVKRVGLLDVLLPVACFGAFAWIAAGLGLQVMEIPWSYYQLLDRVALSEAPGTALLLLHSQPPLLNALLAGILALSGWTGLSPETLAACLFLGLGCIGTVLLYRTVTELFESRVLAVAVVLLTLFDPGYLFFHRLFFYSFILQVLLVLAALLAVRLATTGRVGLLGPMALVLGLVANTSVLFHPIWAVSAFALTALVTAVLHGGGAHLRTRHLVAPSVLLAVLLVAWPLKNQLLFGSFTSSSWSSYNLARQTGESCPALERYLLWGEIPQPVRRALADLAARHPDLDTSVVANVEKTGGARNWNHLVFVDGCVGLGRRALEWRLANPGAWLVEAAANYLRWVRPSYVHPYRGTLPTVGGPAFTAYCGWHRRLLHPDLWRLPGSRAQDALPVTPFAVLLPAVMVLSLLFLGIDLRRLRPTAALLLPWLTVAWVLAVPCLTDGAEGNRMRFAVSPYVLLLSWYVVRRLYEVGSRAVAARSASRS